MHPQKPYRPLALVALLLGAACTDASVTGTSIIDPVLARADVYPAERERGTASADWSAVARDLVSARGSNAFQAVRAYAIVNLAQHNAVVAADAAARGRHQPSRRAAVAAASIASPRHTTP